MGLRICPCLGSLPSWVYPWPCARLVQPRRGSCSTGTSQTLLGTQTWSSQSLPAFDVISRGSHVGNKLATQEFIFLPMGASSFKEAMHIGTEVYHHLKAVIKAKNGKDATNLGNESSFALNILENSEALELLKTAIQEAGYPDKVVIGMDGTASEFYCSGKYDFDFK